MSIAANQKPCFSVLVTFGLRYILAQGSPKLEKSKGAGSGDASTAVGSASIISAITSASANNSAHPFLVYNTG